MDNDNVCPRCGHNAYYYDTVFRKVMTKRHKSYWVDVTRNHCLACGHYFRVLPPTIVPYKLYERDIIKGFVSGEDSNLNLEYNGYPCDDTIVLWRSSQNLQAL
jgi:ribosomal protein L37E